MTGLWPGTVQAAEVWQYGGFADMGYSHNFNHPDNHQWRSKETTPRTNELAPNMGLVYLRKDPAEHSRWGIELALQAGYDTDALVPEPELTELSLCLGRILYGILPVPMSAIWPLSVAD